MRFLLLCRMSDAIIPSNAMSTTREKPTLFKSSRMGQDTGYQEHGLAASLRPGSRHRRECGFPIRVQLPYTCGTYIPQIPCFRACFIIGISRVPTRSCFAQVVFICFSVYVLQLQVVLPHLDLPFIHQVGLYIQQIDLVSNRGQMSSVPVAYYVNQSAASLFQHSTRCNRTSPNRI
jgi:hypothetical protein